jgi:subfamily B ATP-binding cassette protein HlyB/CyaB
MDARRLGSSYQQDTGLACLVACAKFHLVAANYAQLAHHFSVSKRALDESGLVRVARHLKLKARALKVSTEKLSGVAFPAILKSSTGDFFVLAGCRQDVNGNLEYLIQRFGTQNSKPEILKYQELIECWAGLIVLLTKRSLLPFESGKFDISWFIPALVKHKKILYQVLLASFFIQLFALITPLFFQVVIDKVLVHQGLTTLDVLCFGLVVLSLFDVVLNGLRTYVFSHTTTRVDVTLGARLFNHLMHLPIGYFHARQTGTTVARVHELNTIREFITSSALTLIIDLGFTVIFFCSHVLLQPYTDVDCARFDSLLCGAFYLHYPHLTYSFKREIQARSRESGLFG